MKIKTKTKTKTNSTMTPKRLAAAAIVAVVALTQTGCWGSSRAHAVDPPQAREALQTALERWKAGDNPRSLAKSSTPMTVQDFDWAGGVRLADFQILDDGKAMDANLSIRVKLVLEAPGRVARTRTEKTVWYLVGTSPSVTVFRDSMRR